MNKKKHFEYLDSDEFKNKTKATQKNYKSIISNINYSIVGTERPLIKKIQNSYSNINTQQTYLNIILIVRNYLGLSTDLLVKLRNDNKSKINTHRKTELSLLSTTIISYDELMEKFKQLPLNKKYIINYLLINYGFRNSNLNLKLVKELPEEKTENYIVIQPRYILLDMNDYKTKKTYGNKQFKDTNKDFRTAIKSLKLDENQYIIGNKKNDKLKPSYVNTVIKKNTIDQLGEQSINKVIVKEYIDRKDFAKLKQLSFSRGTNLNTLLSSYNMYDIDTVESMIQPPPDTLDNNKE
jgi:hypothetical protein